MIHNSERLGEKPAWPPILGLYKSVVIAHAAVTLQLDVKVPVRTHEPDHASAMTLF
ncbi:MAG: hypothetical protein ACRDPK_08275 [Carbonactinosporaceae bacterium]